MSPARLDMSSDCMQVLQQASSGSVSTVGSLSADCMLAAAGPAAGAWGWSPCGPSRTYANLKDGDYTFMARAPARSAGAAPEMAVSNFTVDTSAPTIEVGHTS